MERSGSFSKTQGTQQTGTRNPQNEPKSQDAGRYAKHLPEKTPQVVQKDLPVSSKTRVETHHPGQAKKASGFRRSQSVPSSAAKPKLQTIRTEKTPTPPKRSWSHSFSISRAKEESHTPSKSRKTQYDTSPESRPQVLHISRSKSIAGETRKPHEIQTTPEKSSLKHQTSLMSTLQPRTSVHLQATQTATSSASSMSQSPRIGSPSSSKISTTKISQIKKLPSSKVTSRSSESQTSALKVKQESPKSPSPLSLRKKRKISLTSMSLPKEMFKNQPGISSFKRHSLVVSPSTTKSPKPQKHEPHVETSRNQNADKKPLKRNTQSPKKQATSRGKTSPSSKRLSLSPSKSAKSYQQRKSKESMTHNPISAAASGRLKVATTPEPLSLIKPGETKIKASTSARKSDKLISSSKERTSSPLKSKKAPEKTRLLSTSTSNRSKSCLQENQSESSNLPDSSKRSTIAEKSPLRITKKTSSKNESGSTPSSRQTTTSVSAIREVTPKAIKSKETREAPSNSTTSKYQSLATSTSKTDLQKIHSETSNMVPHLSESSRSILTKMSSPTTMKSQHLSTETSNTRHDPGPVTTLEEPHSAPIKLKGSPRDIKSSSSSSRHLKEHTPRFTTEAREYKAEHISTTSSSKQQHSSTTPIHKSHSSEDKKIRYNSPNSKRSSTLKRLSSSQETESKYSASKTKSSPSTKARETKFTKVPTSTSNIIKHSSHSNITSESSSQSNSDKIKCENPIKFSQGFKGKSFPKPTTLSKTQRSKHSYPGHRSAISSNSSDPSVAPVISSEVSGISRSTDERNGETERRAALPKSPTEFQKDGYSKPKSKPKVKSHKSPVKRTGDLGTLNYSSELFRRLPYILFPTTLTPVSTPNYPPPTPGRSSENEFSTGQSNRNNFLTTRALSIRTSRRPSIVELDDTTDPVPCSSSFVSSASPTTTTRSSMVNLEASSEQAIPCSTMTGTTSSVTGTSSNRITDVENRSRGTQCNIVDILQLSSNRFISTANGGAVRIYRNLDPSRTPSQQVREIQPFGMPYQVLGNVVPTRFFPTSDFWRTLTQLSLHQITSPTGNLHYLPITQAGIPSERDLQLQISQSFLHTTSTLSFTSPITSSAAGPQFTTSQPISCGTLTVSTPTTKLSQKFSTVPIPTSEGHRYSASLTTCPSTFVTTTRTSVLPLGNTTQSIPFISLAPPSLLASSRKPSEAEIPIALSQPVSNSSTGSTLSTINTMSLASVNPISQTRNPETSVMDVQTQSGTLLSTAPEDGDGTNIFGKDSASNGPKDQEQIELYPAVSLNTPPGLSPTPGPEITTVSISLIPIPTSFSPLTNISSQRIGISSRQPETRVIDSFADDANSRRRRDTNHKSSKLKSSNKSHATDTSNSPVSPRSFSHVSTPSIMSTNTIQDHNYLQPQVTSSLLNTSNLQLENFNRPIYSMSNITPFPLLTTATLSEANSRVTTLLETTVSNGRSILEEIAIVTELPDISPLVHTPPIISPILSPKSSCQLQQICTTTTSHCVTTLSTTDIQSLDLALQPILGILSDENTQVGTPMIIHEITSESPQPSPHEHEEKPSREVENNSTNEETRKEYSQGTYGSTNGVSRTSANSESIFSPPSPGDMKSFRESSVSPLGFYSPTALSPTSRKHTIQNPTVPQIDPQYSYQPESTRRDVLEVASASRLRSLSEDIPQTVVPLKTESSPLKDDKIPQSGGGNSSYSNEEFSKTSENSTSSTSYSPRTPSTTYHSTVDDSSQFTALSESVKSIHIPGKSPLEYNTESVIYSRSPELTSEIKTAIPSKEVHPELRKPPQEKREHYSYISGNSPIDTNSSTQDTEISLEVPVPGKSAAVRKRQHSGKRVTKSSQLESRSYVQLGSMDQSREFATTSEHQSNISNTDKPTRKTSRNISLTRQTEVAELKETNEETFDSTTYGTEGTHTPLKTPASSYETFSDTNLTAPISSNTSGTSFQILEYISEGSIEPSPFSEHIPQPSSSGQTMEFSRRMQLRQPSLLCDINTPTRAITPDIQISSPDNVVSLQEDSSSDDKIDITMSPFIEGVPRTPDVIHSRRCSTCSHIDCTCNK